MTAPRDSRRFATLGHHLAECAECTDGNPCASGLLIARRAGIRVLKRLDQEHRKAREMSP